LILNKRNKTVLSAESKVAPDHIEGQGFAAQKQIPKDLDQLAELIIAQLNDNNLEVSKVRPFFWSLVEAYVDRFQRYPFDVSKVLFSHLELNDYPKDQVEQLVAQLESQYQQVHGRPLRQPGEQGEWKGLLDEDNRHLRDSLKYAAMVDVIK